MDKIAVLDFGGQYAHLIANRLRRLGVYAEIRLASTPVFYLKKYKGIVLSGGPKSVYEKDAPYCDRRLFSLGIPVLGICYGEQLMAKLLGGKVEVGREYGAAELHILSKEGLFKDLNHKEAVWMNHGDKVTTLPLGFEIIGETKDSPHAAIADPRRHFYGVQFHPEVTHTHHGTQILSNFIDICQCTKTWTMDFFVEQKIAYIKNYVRDRKVFMLVSGGVDSTVSYILLAKALGEDNVYGLFVDTGFMRANERQEVEESLKKAGVKNLHVYDASAEFFQALKQVYDPEIKRVVIGNKFLEIQSKVSRDLNLNLDYWMLGQGTIYPDTIESGGTKHASKIKTHHNRVEGIQELIRRKRIIEPVRELYKDEVRELGEKLGLDKRFIWRHPFPGPGLAIRILCTKKEEYPAMPLALERQINMLLGDSENLSSRVLPLKSVGIQGDARTYRNPLLLWGDTTWEELGKISTELTNKCKEINRVVYGFGIQEVNGIKVHNECLTEARVRLLQKVDHIVNRVLFEKDLYGAVWQFPVVLLPVALNGQGKESVVLRPVCSQEAMTANFYPMDMMIVKEIADELMNIPDVSAVFFDITNKPPGTIEWE